MDFEAIYEAYKNEAKPVVLVDEGTGAYDADGNKVTLDQSKIDAARVKLNSEAAAILYKTQRTVGVGSTSGYPLIEDQLDQLYHDMTDGKLGAGATTGNWYVGITSVKTEFPNP